MFLSGRNRAENLPPHEELATFPKHTGSWVGRDNKIPPEVLEVLGPGEFLTRVYWRRLMSLTSIFSLRIFPASEPGYTIHSPQNCLPGAGWTPIEFRRMPLERPGRPAITVNRYVIAKGTDRMLVLYWYEAHGRVAASEYWAKVLPGCRRDPPESRRWCAGSHHHAIGLRREPQHCAATCC